MYKHFKSIKFCFILFCLLAFFFIGCRSKEEKLFTALPAAETGVTFANKILEKPLFNILYYLYYYNGGGVATGDINNDGLADIFFTANSKGNNKLYLNKGNFKFEDITDQAGVKGMADWSSGVTMADVNSDGYLDIYVSAVSGRYNLKGHNELYINNKNHTFTESSATYGLNTSCATTQSAFFDFDRDGDLDCYILNQSHHPHQNIVDTNNRKTFDTLSGDRLYRNDVNINGRFSDVSAQAGIYQSNLGYGLGIGIGDLNNDGWDDIYIGNDFHENDYYYINNGNGTFTESGARHFKHYSRFSMGNDIADYNNDGQLDVITVDMLPPDEKTLKTYGSDENPDIYKVKLEIQGYQNQYSKNCLQRNNGNGVTFSETALSSGVAATDWSWAPLFADFDNDGNKDLFITSGIVKRPVDLDYVRFVSDLKNRGTDRNRSDKFDKETIDAMPDGSSHPFLFKGNGKEKFTDVSNSWGTAGMKGYFNGAAYTDLDNDGKLDIVINALDATAVILKNNAAQKDQIKISFKGDSSNAFGVGTKVWLYTKDKMQYQQMMPTRGFQSSVDFSLHFGLDTLKQIDSILVVWPGQKYQVIKNIVANKTLAVKEEDAAGLFSYNDFFPTRKEVLENVTRNIAIDWKHKENDFLDYNVQYLIPHLQSTRGPKLAVGDINKDGLDDLYVCGAKGQPGTLYTQQPNGNFHVTDSALFNRYAICEDVEATFFDANGDGYPDLWVVSGGNEMPANQLAAADRLFINDGKGHFRILPNSIPHHYENKSCVTTADIDKDGDMDVFVGFLSDPLRYGIPQNSYLYLNDGKGIFSIAPTNTMNLLQIGMVTSAVFTDVNNDEWPDLIVSGEWMPMKVYINDKGIFKLSDVAQSTGLWQTVYTTDIDDDGDNDILAGNWGHNSKLYSGKNGPCKLYVKDFDKNGSIEPIMCYTIDGNEYTFLAKDELERALPVLKKYYLKYSEVAGKTVQFVFYDLFKDNIESKAEVLSSSCFINDGKGNFTRLDLPEELQLAPVMAFTSTPTPGTFIAAGNFYGVIPYEGRYDAMLPTGFSFNSNTRSFDIKFNTQTVDGEVRDAKWITLANDEMVLALSRNNQSIIFSKYKNEK
jgi:hypothetical protein